MSHSRVTVERDTVSTVGNLGFCQTAEVSKLHDLSLLRIDCRQFVERLIEQQQLAVWRLGFAHAIIQYHSHGGAKALAPSVPSRVIDQDPAHHLRRDSIEVRAILPDDALLPH